MKLLGVTAPYTGSGKTLTTLAILSQLPDSISFKVGPDFIDGQLHSSISGHATATIDRWLQGDRYRKVPCDLSQNHSFGIVEGVMGMYDSGTSINASTDYYLRKLKIPYILVVEVSRTAESAYHLAKGFIRKGCIGVVLNDCYSNKHLELVSNEFVKHGIRVIGHIMHSEELKLPERHLGINTEIEPGRIRRIGKKASENLDLSFMDDLEDIECPTSPEPKSQFMSKNIWVARDKAFNFYYESSIRVLERLGKVRYFSPLADEAPEEADLIYIGGGYPELYSSELENASKTRSSILQHSESGTPIIAECGGLMYLESEIETKKGTRKMAGVFPGRVNANKDLTLSYTKLKALRDSILFREGETAYGHEFHYSTIEDETERTLKNIIGKGISGGDGIQVRNTFGSYSHFDLYRYSRRLQRFLS